MKLSEKILSLRTAWGLSQGDLAEKLEVSRQSVSKWETGQSVPDLDKILKISDLFGVTTDYLLRENEEQTPQPDSRTLYAEEPEEREPAQKKELSAGCITTVVLLAAFATAVFALFVSGSIRDETAGCLLAASCIFIVELLVFRRYPWATVLWTAVGLLPFWFYVTGNHIDRGTESLMFVIGSTAAAFGLFLTYRKK